MSALTVVPTQGAAPAASTMSLAAMTAELECLLDTAEMVEEGTADRAELEAQIAEFQAAMPWRSSNPRRSSPRPRSSGCRRARGATSATLSAWSGIAAG